SSRGESRAEARSAGSPLRRPRPWCASCRRRPPGAWLGATVPPPPGHLLPPPSVAEREEGSPAGEPPAPATDDLRPDATGTDANVQGSSARSFAVGRSPTRANGPSWRQLSLPVATWSLPFLAILGIAALIFLASFWLDLITAALDDQPGEVTASGLLHSVLYQDLEQARNTLGGLGEVMAAVLGLALTVSSIIVQLAATRFTPHITSLFFRARTNLMILGFFVTCSVYVLWVNFSVDTHYLPRFGVLFSMLLMTASLLLLFPYFAYVFDFLDPEKIVGRIMDDGLAAATPIRGRAAGAIEARQARAVEAVEHL